MKYKYKAVEEGFTKENVLRELDHLIAQYYQEYDEMPTQILVDNFTIWDLIGVGVGADESGAYKDMPITVTILLETAQILVTDDEGIEDITALLKETSNGS